ncbi:uncharacterized protein si:dkey-114l24.2 [Kryptolebias marmoratus]|uniref:uncharacterized protein si:dkey-114l24.2 n=1 Tax=Kryptolebias marmoratus TaxID=37003 RepID=UPI0018AD027D|nr:uncharacterized protein si:dkey-114l24.2 [Kryptolebias marmoratus]
MIWSLCLLCVAGGLSAVHAGPIRKTGRMEDKAAPQEEVNVLMFGVIQLSESLSYVFETTEAKMKKISQTLKAHEDTLQKLGKQTEQAAETEQQIKEVVQLLQAQMAKQQAQTQMTKNQLNSIEKDEEELKTKVKRLEMYLNNSALDSIKELKDRAEEHSNILQGLQLLTHFQKENLKNQNEQLSKLQKMRGAMA